MNCTIHHISDKVLYQLVLCSIQRLSSHIIADERGFAEELKSKWEAQANGKPQKQKDELQTINRRLNELDRLIGSLYENFISGLLPEKQYKSLMKKYSAEQDNLESQVSEIQEKLEQTKASSAHIGRQMTVISTRSVSANSAVRSFIRTAQGRGFATPIVRKPISKPKKKRNAMPKRATTPSVKRSARFAACPSGRPTVRRCYAPRNVRQSTAGRNSLPIIIVSNPSRKPEKQYKTKEDDTMEKFITDERTGLQYELVEDYYLIAGEDEPEGRHIGIWGQRHLRYLKQHRKVLYSELLISGKLNDYLADLNDQAEELFSQLVKQLAEKEGVTKALKAENQMLWVQKMNNIRNAVMEVVSNDLIYE